MESEHIEEVCPNCNASFDFIVDSDYMTKEDYKWNANCIWCDAEYDAMFEIDEDVEGGGLWYFEEVFIR